MSNQEVNRKIVTEIMDTPGIEYTEEEIKGNNTQYFCAFIGSVSLQLPYKESMKV